MCSSGNTYAHTDTHTQRHIHLNSRIIFIIFLQIKNCLSTNLTEEDTIYGKCYLIDFLPKLQKSNDFNLPLIC